MPAGKKSTAAAAFTATTVPLAPVVFLKGPADFFADRAVEHLREAAAKVHADIEVVNISAPAYQAADLDYHTSPSLFGDHKLVIISNLEAGSDACFMDLERYVAAPSTFANVIIRYGSGQKGKKLLTALAAANVPTVACEPLTKDADKATFVAGEFRRYGRRVDADAVGALINAVGSDVRELYAACRQLAQDSQTPQHGNVITADVVNKYFGGRVEATAFKVADAIAAGDTAAALVLCRQAFQTGASAVPLVAAVAAEVRQLAKMSAAQSGGLTAKDVGMAPWQMDRARRDLRAWTPLGLRHAVVICAQLDADVKGQSRDAEFAVERAVVRLGQFRRAA